MRRKDICVSEIRAFGEMSQQVNYATTKKYTVTSTDSLILEFGAAKLIQAQLSVNAEGIYLDQA